MHATNNWRVAPALAFLVLRPAKSPGTRKSSTTCPGMLFGATTVRKPGESPLHWRKLTEASGTQILTKTGGMVSGKRKEQRVLLVHEPRASLRFRLLVFGGGAPMHSCHEIDAFDVFSTSSPVANPTEIHSDLPVWVTVPILPLFMCRLLVVAVFLGNSWSLCLFVSLWWYLSLRISE